MVSEKKVNETQVSKTMFSHLKLKRDIPKFDTVLLHSNWNSLRRKYFGVNPTDINAFSCGPKA